MVDRDQRYRHGPDATRYPSPGWSDGPPRHAVPEWPPAPDRLRPDSYQPGSYQPGAHPNGYQPGGYHPGGYHPGGYQPGGYAPTVPPYRGEQDASWSRYGGRPAPEPHTRPAWGRRRLDASPWHWLLFIPVTVPLIVPLYNRIEPTLGGVPFYYWGQLAFALLSSAVVTIVHLATKGR